MWGRGVTDVFVVLVRGVVFHNAPGLVVDIKSTGFLHLIFGF
jgi:hypothetical protein